MPVNITWVDQSSREDVHHILRKPVGSGEYTTVASLSSLNPSSTGVVEYLDMATLAPGDYSYTVVNDDIESGMTASSNTFTITSIDIDKRALCINMTGDTLDFTGIHYTTNNGTTINAAVSATEFDGNSNISVTDSIVLGDTFSITLNINPSSTRSTDSILFITRNGINLSHSLNLTVDGAITFSYRNTANSVITVSTPTATVPVDVWSNIHVTRDLDENTNMYVDTSLITTHIGTDTIEVLPAGQPASIGSDYTDYSTGYIGMMTHLSIVNDQVVLPNTCIECTRFVPLELLPPVGVHINVSYPVFHPLYPPLDLSTPALSGVDPEDGFLFAPIDVTAVVVST